MAIHCAPVGGITDSHSPCRAIMRYHKLKMEEINKIIRELWMKTYKGGGEQLVTRWIAAASGRDCMWPPPPALGVCLPLVWRYSAPPFQTLGASFPGTGAIVPPPFQTLGASFPGTGAIVPPPFQALVNSWCVLWVMHGVMNMVLLVLWTASTLSGV